MIRSSVRRPRWRLSCWRAPARSRRTTRRGPSRCSCRSPPADRPTSMPASSAQRLQESLGQPFVIENRPGAGAIIGTDDGGEERARRLHAARDVEHAYGQRIADSEPAVSADARLRAGRADQLVGPRAGRPSVGAREYARRSSSRSPRRSRASSTTRPPVRARRITWPASCSSRWPASTSSTCRTRKARPRAPR